MTWLQQAVHVMNKDLRGSRIYLFPYVLLVGIGTILAIAEPPRENELVQLLTTLLAFAWVAFIVQADSPYKSTAFWSSKPIRPTAVWAGKLLCILLAIVGTGLTGRFVALVVGFHLEPAALLSDLVKTGWAYALMLTAAAFVATLTPDPARYFVAIILSIIAAIMLASLRPATASNAVLLSAETLVTMQVALLLALIGTAAMVYRWRTRKYAIVIAALLLVGTAFIARPIEFEPDQVPTLGENALLENSKPVLRAWFDQGEAREQNRVDVILRLDNAADGYAYSVAGSRLNVQTPDGKYRRAGVWLVPTTIGAFSPPRIPGVVWPQEHERTQLIGHAFGLMIDNEYQQGIETGTARAQLETTIRAHEPRIQLTVPVGEGNATAADGVRVHIGKVIIHDRTASIEVRVVGIRSPIKQRTQESAGVEFGLINKKRGEGILLQQRNSSFSGFPIVIGGNAAFNKTATLVTDWPGEPGRSVRIDQHWLKDAELVRFEWPVVKTWHASPAVSSAPPPSR